MNMFKAVRYLFPEAIPNIDFLIKDDGDGPEIGMWRIEAQQPTEQELMVAWDAYVIAEANKPPAPPTQAQIDNDRLDQMELMIADIIMGGV